MKIILTGDLLLGGDLSNASIVSLVISNSFSNADNRIVNLEHSISDNTFVAEKCVLYTESYATELLKQLKISAVNLAYNHIYDKLDE